jgi:[protein-PII] uridylyltransferase
MREYYTHTRAIFRITEDCLEDLGHGDNVGVMLGRGRVSRDGGKLNVAVRRDKLQKDPLYIFAIQKQTGQKLDRGLRRRLGAALQTHIKGAAILRSMRRRFVDLVSDDNNTALVVRSLHDTLFLMRIIPEYGQLTCLKRYDLYHHYTVDEHSFKVLENLTALGRQDADSDDPFVRLYSEISEKRALILTALLHDVGKIEGRGHAKKGAALSRQILTRMGLAGDEIDFVCSLIEKHLVMSHYSQRRDPSDLGTITAFCDKVGDRTALKHLCLITYADYRATSPEVWTDWKKTLLWEIYVRAYDFMARREKQPEQVYKQHKQGLLDAFPEGERNGALAHLDLLPGGYLLNMSPEMVHEHMRMIESLEGAPCAVSHERVGDIHRVTFVTHDKPYRLSELCGVLTVNDFNILHAFAFTRKDGVVIDVFNVDHVNRSIREDEIAGRVDSIRNDLNRIFESSLDLNSATTEHAARWRRIRKVGIPMGVTVKFENDVSDDFTIIDVFTQDRPGLLYRITRALSSEGLTIFRANISTEATRAIDSFYVGDESGQKVSSASRLRRIREALEAEIDQPG